MVEQAAKTPIVEEGSVSFFYRPRVGVGEAHGLADVQRFHMLMSPTSREAAPHRLVILGKKRLPDVTKHERFFGFVDAVSPQLQPLIEGLGAKEYETKTRGRRRVEPARALGEGAYAITDKGSSTRFDYELVVPREPGEVQEEFRISRAAEYILQVKNPERQTPGPLAPARAAHYPPEKEAEFQGRAWTPVRDPELLDVPGVQLLLIGAHAQLPRGMAQELEQQVQEELRNMQLQDGEELLRKLRANVKAEDIDLEPAVKREWV